MTWSGNINSRRALPAFVLALGLLAGCGVLPGGGPPAKMFTLTPKNTFDEQLPAVDWQLVVEEPSAAGGLQVQSIALRTRAIELQYFAGARWTERAPRMIQTLLVESFENSGKIVAVGRQTIGLRSDFNLKTELREFQAEYGNPNQPPMVHVRLSALLIQQPRREIIASENFDAKVAAASTSMEDVILAFDDALGKVIRRTVEWSLTTGAGAYRPR
ncbi:MAG: ABC-type transport auxiliary lipoprotein family protein [Proteobacteria bacterium]|nr:ABC-type transport auxiliary lipoprotein family protein [Pseudomonadota bacterium]MDA1057092.1 ABC-type transport auxiliary lipoprotein family protein [Pseudomonadota bacterium]